MFIRPIIVAIGQFSRFTVSTHLDGPRWVRFPQLPTPLPLLSLFFWLLEEKEYPRNCNWQRIRIFGIRVWFYLVLLFGVYFTLVKRFGVVRILTVLWSFPSLFCLLYTNLVGCATKLQRIGGYWRGSVKRSFGFRTNIFVAALAGVPLFCAKPDDLLSGFSYEPFLHREIVGNQCVRLLVIGALYLFIGFYSVPARCFD